MDRALPLRSRLFGRPVRAAGRLALASALALAAAQAQALFVVNQPRVKPGTRSSEAYMVLASTEGATLVGVRAPAAARAWLQRPGSAAGRGAATLVLPAGVPVSLRPGGDRIALSGLAHPLKLGERVRLTLTLETAAGAREEIAVDAEVRREAPLEAERRAHHR